MLAWSHAILQCSLSPSTVLGMGDGKLQGDCSRVQHCSSVGYSVEWLVIRYIFPSQYGGNGTYTVCRGSAITVCTVCRVFKKNFFKAFLSLLDLMAQFAKAWQQWYVILTGYYAKLCVCSL